MNTFNVRSTAFVIESIDYEKLNQYFSFVKYPVSNQFRWKKDKMKFKKMYVALKNNLHHPHYFFSPETYVLTSMKKDFLEMYPFPPITLDFLKQEINPQSYVINPDEVKTHILLKNMLSAYFYFKSDQLSKDHERRICQHKFFVVGEIKNDKYATGIELELKEREGIFYIKNHATGFTKTTLKKKDFDYLDKTPYYELVTKEGTDYFRQLRSDEVRDFITDSKKKLWRDSKGNKSHPTQANYFDTNYRTCRSFVVWNFQEKFTKFLRQYGIYAYPKTADFHRVELLNFQNKDYNFKKFIEGKRTETKEKYAYRQGFSETGLPISQLKTIYVYDNRLRRETDEKLFSTIPIDDYLELLRNEYQENLGVDFQLITDKELTPNFSKPVLLIQDVGGLEFREKPKKNEEDETTYFFLAHHGYEDPKAVFYEKYPQIPKQSLGVNSKVITKKTADKKLEAYEKNPESYFDYKLPNLSKRSSQEKWNVCLNELHLKNMLLNQVSISEGLNIAISDTDSPLQNSFKDMLFLHERTLLFIENGRFEWIDSTRNKNKLHQKLQEFGVDWTQVIEAYKEKHYLKIKQNESEIDFIKRWRKHLKEAYFVIAKGGKVAEIEELEEQFLPDWKTIQRKTIEKNKAGYIYKAKDVSDWLIGIWYNSGEQTYSAGLVNPLNRKQPKFSKMRKINTETYKRSFSENQIQDLLKSLSVQFVRNKQYTVYPYPFDFIRLLVEITQVSE